MSRVRGAPSSRRRRKKILKAAKGYRGARSKLIRTATESVHRAGQYAYRDRKRRKGDMRRLWIIRINAGARIHGLSYSRFMHGLREANVEVDRKMLADMAVHDADGFAKLVTIARGVSE
ncbi:MAG: 50S ribosomal protein L20 [Candidatus Eisenbacteria sp.]|jgi:large subunit ribosomal protein L20|nr:50S ribosomal protein L20 [Candidatus Eisenbacteria bacterium]